MPMPGGFTISLLRQSRQSSLPSSSRCARLGSAQRTYHSTPIFKQDLQTTTTTDTSGMEATASEAPKNVKTTSGEEPKTEYNTVRTLDRLASALRARQAGHEAAHKLSRLRGGGFWADRHLAKPPQSSSLDSLKQQNGDSAQGTIKLPESRKMSDSYIEIDLPFESEPALLETYIGAFTSVRVGRIMEDLDSIAGSVAYKHVLPDGCGPRDAAKSGLYIVTAAVDRLDMLRPFSQTEPEDLRLSGHVYSTGNSTMEITIRLQSISRSRGLQNNPETILLGRFTMACRDSETGKAKKVPKLITEGEDEKRLQDLGKEQREKKIANMKRSLDVVPPNEEESTMLHTVFTKFADYYKAGASVPEEVVWMKKGSRLESVLMMHPQSRNVHHKIFGGYLMRLAYEAAYSTGCLFAEGPIRFLALDELSFKNPVTIGSLLQLTTAVTFSPIQNYQEHKSFQVSVEAATIDIHTGERLVTNTFHYTFASEAPLRKFILPEDYFDGLKWLESMRRREAGREIRKLYGL